MDNQAVQEWEARELLVVEATYRTFTEGGYSMWFDGVERTAGYSVGNNNDPIAPPSDYGLHQVREILINSALGKEYNDTIYDGVGLWMEAGGTVYIDNITHVESLASAVVLAIRNGEKSIYDLANQCCIDL